MLIWNGPQCTWTIGCNIAWCGWKPNPCTGSPMIHACTNNFRLTSSKVFNCCMNRSKASFDISIADIHEQNNVLHICWLCCNNTSKHLGWHTVFVIWFWAQPICLDALLFHKSLHKNYNLFIQVIDARSFGGAKVVCFLFICQWFGSLPGSFRGNGILKLHHNGFGLITLLSFIQLIKFFWPIWIPLWWSCIKSSKQCNIYIYIYSGYLHVKVKERMSLQTVAILWHGKEHTPSWARTHDLSITYRVPLIIVMSQILKAMHLK